MEEKYKSWIIKIKSEYNVLTGLCGSISRKMIENFPELRLARGYFIDDYGAKHSHWWCVSSDGIIIDPTVDQFKSNFEISAARYEEYDELKHGPLPIGRCYDCGSYIYAEDQGEDYSSSNFCNIECEKNTMEYLRNC